MSSSTPAQTKSAKSAQFHIPSLDGIRAISFLIVFFAHAGLGRIVPGGFGVTVFFFLSGYLITTLLRLEYDKYGTISLKEFYLRRVLRILPPFYLVLALAVIAALVGVVGGPIRVAPVAAQALHMANYWIIQNGYTGQATGTGVYWSLAVEEHFYLFFPWLYLALRKFLPSQSRQAWVLWALCAVVLAWRCLLVFALHAPEDRTYVASDTRVDSILFGCALAVYGNPVLDKPGPTSISDALWKRLFLPGALLLLLFTFLYRGPGFRETFRYSLQGIALYGVFIAAMRFPAWGLFRLLNTRAASFLGVLSYSLYLTHHVILDAIQRLIPVHPAVQAAITLALSIGMAWSIYQLVEKPCAKLRKRLSRGAPTASDAAGSSGPSAKAETVATGPAARPTA
jgi:peptidoglycan/LPS O-acetylase OafA/YrhL